MQKYLAILVLIASLFVGFATPRPARAQAAAALPPTTRAALMAAITAMVREQIPHQYEDTSKWGMTTEVWDGLHVRREGLRIKTKRRKKEVNHGAWTLYRIELTNPQEEFRIRVEKERELAEGGVAFDLVFAARLHVFGRRSRWVKGVQLISLSADADARVELRLSCKLAMSLDITQLPPDVVFHPQVDDARLDITYFRVDRISEVGGTLAKELGHGIERVLQKKVDEKRDRLVEKVNSAIDRHSDKLRISFDDLVASKWKRLTKHVSAGSGEPAGE